MWKLMRLLGRQKGMVVFAIFLTMVSSLLNLALPYLMREMINEGITQGDIGYIYQTGFFMLLLAIGSMAVALINSYCSSRVAMRFGRELRRDLFYKVESLHQCDIDTVGTASLITRSTNDIRQVQDFFMMLLRMIIPVPFMFLGGVIMVFFVNVQMSSVLLFAIPFIALVAWWISKHVMPMFSRVQKLTDRLNQVLREKLNGIRVVRAFNQEEQADKRFRESNWELTGIALKIERIFAWIIPLATGALYLVVVVIIAMAVSQVSNMDAVTQAGEIADMVGDTQAFIIYLLMIIFAVGMAAAMLVMLPRANVSAQRINEVLDMQPQIRETDTSLLQTKKEDDPEQGTVVFQNVSFQYPGAESPVLTDVSFAAKQGQTVAIIGGTGAGKSTLINLIPRFYDVTQGEVLVDGLRVQDMKLAELHHKVGFVPQQAFLFSGTVADNIRFGKEDATEDEIWEALRIAQAAEFVEKLPNGLYDMISQSGKNLSGGQKQRLAIARALVRRANVYVFDDSFSALDYTTDANLRRAIKENLADTTMIIVAQRVGTIMDADQILVLEDGALVGAGKHKELLGNCPTYREIALSQLPEEELA